MCNISDQDGFSFSLRSQPQGRRISAEDAERLLLERLKRCERDFLSVLSDLAYFYSATGRQRQAQAYLERYVANTDDPEKRAGCIIPQRSSPGPRRPAPHQPRRPSGLPMGARDLPASIRQRRSSPDVSRRDRPSRPDWRRKRLPPPPS